MGFGERLWMTADWRDGVGIQRRWKKTGISKMEEPALNGGLFRRYY